jgi:hypothetical protein
MLFKNIFQKFQFLIPFHFGEIIIQVSYNDISLPNLRVNLIVVLMTRIERYL